MPIAWARLASILSVPVSSISLACLGSTAHGSSMATMPVPKRTSGSPNLVPSAARVMSQASATSKAPAMQKPWTSAMVGLGQSQNAMMKSNCRSIWRRT